MIQKPRCPVLLATFLLAASVSARQNLDTAMPAATTAAPATNATPVIPGADPVENSVVKVFSTVRYPDLFRPWTKQSPSEISGTGVVIEGKRILSNAHVVNYASQVQIQANQAGDKLSATVVAIYPGIDLAVLKLDDETFFDTHAPLPRAKVLPQIKDTVMVYGYPTGGASLSITKGIVSRIEFAQYNFPASGLRVQIDAAINPGNSGGPAVVGDKMIGLAFSRLATAENIGYIIPCEEIDLFLKGVADGKPEGKPAIEEKYQTLENPALRKFLQLDKTTHGLVVSKPLDSDSAYPLKTWDLITKIGDFPVDDQGMVQLGNLRVFFTYEVQHIAQNGTVPLTVVRAGKEVHLNLPVETNRSFVLPYLQGTYPSYFVYGPMVFCTATRDFVSALARDPRLVSGLISLGSPMVTRSTARPAFPGEEMVVVSSPFFPHKLSEGYSNPFGEVIKSINGTAIKNLGHLVQVLRDCRDEMITIEFDADSGEKLVFPRAEMAIATDGILTDNGVRSQGTPDMMAIWDVKKTGN